MWTGRTVLSVCWFCFQKEQHGRSLNSYVVASSVGNFSVSDLMEPVQIEIAHLSEQVCVCACVWWLVADHVTHVILICVSVLAAGSESSLYVLGLQHEW